MSVQNQRLDDRTEHPEDPGDPSAPSMRTLALLLAVVASIGLVGGLAYWDAIRESRAALEDLALEQVNVAKGIAAALALGTDEIKQSVLAGAPWGPPGLERSAALKWFLLPPRGLQLDGSDGKVVSSERVIEAARAGAETVRLSRPEALALGLPARSGLVGLATIDRGPLAGWTIAVAATALRERDRERWAQKRLLLTVLAPAGLLLLLGGIALRNQRKELELQRELAVAAAREDQRDRLASASRTAALGTLALGVAHEVSTPLGVITGRAEQLLGKLHDDPRGIAAANAILEQTQRISEVIRGLLGLARGDRMSSDNLSAIRIAERAVALVEHRFQAAGIRLALDLVGNAPSLRGDARLLENAIVNLLLNACDASARDAGVRLVVEEKDHRVRFSVDDDGSGIQPEHAQKVLEPFFTTKANGEGTGLGLAIANEIVKSHLGTISLTPRSPRGTRAVVEIPADQTGTDA
jgi:two-component system, NtrC family, sensor kinase